MQRPLVEKCKELGVYSICFAWEDGAVCKDLCDKFYPISTIDKEEILKVCQEEKIDGITTIASDVATLTVNYVAEQMGADWRKVHTGVLLSGYINDTHTYVPGPDGKFGYGGKCFPKDVNAFAKMTEGTPLGTLLEHLHELNVHFRGVEEHI